MSYRVISTLQRQPGLLLMAILIGWTVACRPAAAGGPSAQSQSQPYTFYLGTWTETNDDNKLIPLDPQTLEDQSGGTTLELGTFSADGSTQVVVEYSEGRSVNSPNLDPEEVWIVVYDVPGGTERGRFHPPASGLIYDLSEDGGRLLLQPFPFPPGYYPPPVEWYVIDTTSGEPVTHIKDGDNACYRQNATFDPAGQRIFCVVDPDLDKSDKPQPMRIVAYDVESGLKSEELELPQILVGGSVSGRNDQALWEFLEPAISLSPDGHRLAVVHADADKITLIDADNLSVEKTVSLHDDTALWDWFGLMPAIAHAKGKAQGTIRQTAFSADGQYLYVFTQEIWVEPEDAPAERGLWLVDLERERFVESALPDYQIQWLRPAPDGTVYAFGTTEERLLPYEIRRTSPSRLWRLDGLSLEILAEREFTGYRGGWLVGGEAAPHETSS